MDRVPEQERDTVGEAEEQHQPGGGGQQAVGAVLDGAAVLPPDEPDAGTVDLIRADHLPPVHAEEGEDPTVVLLDRVQVVADGMAQVEGSEGPLAHPAQAGEDGVGETGAVQSLKLVEEDTVGRFPTHW